MRSVFIAVKDSSLLLTYPISYILLLYFLRIPVLSSLWFSVVPWYGSHLLSSISRLYCLPLYICLSPTSPQHSPFTLLVTRFSHVSVPPSRCVSTFLYAFPPLWSATLDFKDKSHFVPEALSSDSGLPCALFSLHHKLQLLHPLAMR